MKWKGKLIKQFIGELKNDSQWSKLIEKVSNGSTVGVHLAVFNEPFLDLILSGEKKIESRFSINKIRPFMKVTKGDIIILKKSGGHVVGVFVAGKVKYFSKLSKTDIKKIEEEYGKLICSNYDKEFWKIRSKIQYASLIEIGRVKKVNPIRAEKKDRSGWSILQERTTPTLF